MIGSFNGFARWLNFGNAAIGTSDPEDQEKHITFNTIDRGDLPRQAPRALEEKARIRWLRAVEQVTSPPTTEVTSRRSGPAGHININLWPGFARISVVPDTPARAARAECRAQLGAQAPYIWVRYDALH
jgi:hypothetical protein